MNPLINAKDLQASLPAIVEKVRRGACFIVLYQGRPAFQILPVTPVFKPTGDLARDLLYEAKTVSCSAKERSATKPDPLL